MDNQGPVWEVFLQKKAGQPFVHCGSLHAFDKEMALENALMRLNERVSNFALTDTHEAITAVIDIDTDVADTLFSNKITEIKAEQEAQPIASLVDMVAGDKVNDQAFDDELLDIYLTEAEEDLLELL